MIKNYDPATLNTGVTLPKLSPAGGTALQLIRVNATATNFEFVSLASLVTVGSILPSAISGVAVAPGTTRFLGNYNAGTTTWFTAGAIVDEIVQGTIPADLLGVPGALSARSKFITARTADTFATYRYFEPNTDMLNATMNGSKLQDATVGPEKIYSAGVPDGYLMGKVAGVPDWVAPLTITGATTKFVNTVAETITQAVPTAVGAGTSIPHTLGQMPTTYRVAFYCQTAEFEYIQGDEIEILGLYRANGFSSDEQSTAYNIRVTSSAVIVQAQQPTWAMYGVSKTTGTPSTALTPGNWRLRLYATYTS
jgi:hypothetical protein